MMMAENDPRKNSYYGSPGPSSPGSPPPQYAGQGGMDQKGFTYAPTTTPMQQTGQGAVFVPEADSGVASPRSGAVEMATGR